MSGSERAAIHSDAGNNRAACTKPDVVPQISRVHHMNFVHGATGCVRRPGHMPCGQENGPGNGTDGHVYLSAEI
jgi:hypothetical protein